ncbi:KIN17-like protein [Seminavis robusta]|uniref:KIN17-like protein n=1 Tax=Seminavis robusta TaxID=568900 RepID=A0A9N8H8P2_9STRA|nr:KIN17-like protein [Seminavis robusta]|eukprot:Sro176_g077420.1 KIN17-like protein (437) ;mRNA; r:58183-59676
MGKAEKGTPKDIAKRIKSKGLQKLKFYCQMCEKQCRDANGFKCHMTSEAHLRQMKIFSENAKGIMDRYSREFESSYLQTLRQRHTTKRVNANNVYQEVIQDKQHIHMNSTRWASLSDFVMYLGKKGKCVVDETERGWYVQYIEVDAGILARQAAQERRVEAEKAAEIAQAERMEKQRIEAAKAFDLVGGTVHREATKLERDESTAAVKVSLSSKDKKKTTNKTSSKLGFFADEDDEASDDEDAPKSDAIVLPETTPNPSATTRHIKRSVPQSASDKDCERESSKRPRKAEEKMANDQDTAKPKSDKSTRDEDEKPWLKRDIIVRVVTKKLHDGKYFRRKGIVDRVLKDNKFCAEVELLDSSPDQRDGGDILRLDQNDLETVVPKEGKKVRILKGEFRGEKAKLISADKKKYRATLKLLDDGTVLEKIDFEDFSQLA